MQRPMEDYGLRPRWKQSPSRGPSPRAGSWVPSIGTVDPMVFPVSEQGIAVEGDRYSVGCSVAPGVAGQRLQVARAEIG
jgi:hypothetical protein